jgi:uncharacterized protein YsxB (DUF464 family)
MVIVESRIGKDDKGREQDFYLKVTGHAGSAEKGRDIVCASASILLYTLAQTVKALEQKGRLKEAPAIRTDSGDAEIGFTAKAKYSAECAHCFFTVLVGYQLLCHNYPMYVRFK